MSRYRFILAEQASYPVAVLCRTLGVARSGYYDWLRRPTSARHRADLALTEQIRVVHADSRQTYGSPRVHAAVRQQGIRCSRKRVARLMRQMGLAGAIRGKTAKTTVSDRSAPCPLDRVKRQFQAPRPNALWLADFTYVATWQGFVYVAFVIDAFARRIAGWRDDQRHHQSPRHLRGTGEHVVEHRYEDDDRDRVESDGERTDHVVQ